MEHVQGFDSKLSGLIQDKPSEYIPILEEAAREVVSRANQYKLEDTKQIQVIITGFNKFTSIRHLSSEHVSKLVSIRGIVVSAGRPRIKATKLMVMCRNCKVTKPIVCGAGFGGARLPRE
jgi:DNA replication licensing factor MCM5